MKPLFQQVPNDARAVELLRLELIWYQRELEKSRRRLQETEKLMEASQLKKARTELRRSDPCFTEGQSITHAGNWCWKLSNGKFVWSEEQYRLLGFDPGTTVPSFNLFLERVHPEDRLRVRESIHRAMHTKADLNLEFRVSLPSGDVKHIYSISYPVTTERGTAPDFVGIFMDVSVRKRAEILLAGEKRLLEMVAKGNPISAILPLICRLVEEVCVGLSCSILVLDPKTKQIRHMVGGSLPKRYRNAIGSIIDPATIWCVTDAATNAPRAGFYTSSLPLPPGLRACWSTPIVSKDNKVLGTFTTFGRKPGTLATEQQDVLGHIARLASIAIERTKTDETLRRSEAYLAEGQRLSHVGSWAWIPLSGEVFWSREIFRIFGVDPRTANVNMELAMRCRHPDDRALAEKTFETAFQNGTDFEMDSRIVCPNGAVKHVHTVGHPVFSAEGKLTEFIGVVMDITERYKANEALRKAQAELAHVTRLTAMGELTASIAHELNQPLAAILTNANASLRWLNRRAPNLEEARCSMRRIIRDGTRGGDVIARVRALLKKEAPSKTLLNMGELIQEIIKLVRADLPGIMLQTKSAAQLPPVIGDRVQLQQVLLNLILNAADAMKSITDRPRSLKIRTKKHPNHMVLVAVQDSGTGVAAEHIKKIFDAFYTTKPGGLGMGLSICRSIIEGHGGRLWVESNKGPGVTFQFTLPSVKGAKT